MATNKDGLEPGQPVEFDTILRVEKQRATQGKTESKSEAPQKMTRTRKASAE